MGCAGSKPSEVAQPAAVTLKAEIAPPSPRASAESLVVEPPAASKVTPAEVELHVKEETAPVATAEETAIAEDIVSRAIATAVDNAESFESPPAEQETAPPLPAPAVIAKPAAEEPASPSYAANYEEVKPQEETQSVLQPLADFGRSLSRRLSNFIMPMVPAQIIKAEWQPPQTSLFVSHSHSCGTRLSKAPFVSYAAMPCTPPSGTAFTSHVTWPLHERPFISHAASFRGA
jgi:hypothetical protein